MNDNEDYNNLSNNSGNSADDYADSPSFKARVMLILESDEEYHKTHKPEFYI